MNGWPWHEGGRPLQLRGVAFRSQFRMLSFERLAVVYFTSLGVAALFAWTGRRSVRGILSAAAAALVVVVISRTASVDVRVWLPHAYLLIGYWLPALLVADVSPGVFERWLVGADTRWRRYAIVMPPWAAHAVELSYLLCYTVVPVAFAVTWMGGTPADIERFWVSVLASGFACYGSLPWLPSRPPRLVDGRRPAGALGTINAAILARASHQLNTFPSGHVAVSVAAAGRALAVWWPAGVVLSTVAVGIAVGAIVGRYHYVVDVLLGVSIGVICSLIVLAF